MLIYDQIIEQADVPNANGRIYPKKLLERIINEHQDDQIFGQLGPAENSKISFDFMSHVVSGLRMADGFLMADIGTIKSCQGPTLENLLKTGTVVFRLRGVGSIENNVVQDDYQLVAIDAVPNEKIIASSQPWNVAPNSH